MAGLQKKNKIVMKRSVAAPNEDSFYQRSEEYTEKALEKKSVALGYTFDQTDYSNEIAAVTSVMSQYLSSLEYGTVDDLDSYYEEFTSALDDAGMDNLIAANQEQLNAFLGKIKKLFKAAQNVAARLHLVAIVI